MIQEQGAKPTSSPWSSGPRRRSPRTTTSSYQRHILVLGAVTHAYIAYVVCIGVHRWKSDCTFRLYCETIGLSQTEAAHPPKKAPKKDSRLVLSGLDRAGSRPTHLRGTMACKTLPSTCAKCICSGSVTLSAATWLPQHVSRHCFSRTILELSELFWGTQPFICECTLQM